jgi:hypothetical protein
MRRITSRSNPAVSGITDAAAPDPGADNDRSISYLPTKAPETVLLPIPACYSLSFPRYMFVARNGRSIPNVPKLDRE